MNGLLNLGCPWIRNLSPNKFHALWLIKDNNVRLIPHSSGKNNLNLLSSGKSRILKMLLNIFGGKKTDVKSSTLSNFNTHSLHGITLVKAMAALEKEGMMLPEVACPPCQLLQEEE